MDACALLLYANSVGARHSGHVSCLWSMNAQRYCSSSWFIHSVCPLDCRWKAVARLDRIPSIAFNSLVICAANCGPRSNMMDSSNLCSFHTLSLYNAASPCADVASVVGIMWTILDIQLHTTNIVSYPCASGSFTTKSTEMCVQGHSGAEFSISFPAGGCACDLFH